MELILSVLKGIAMLIVACFMWPIWMVWVWIAFVYEAVTGKLWNGR